MSPASFAGGVVLGPRKCARHFLRPCVLAADEPWLGDLRTDYSAGSYSHAMRATRWGVVALAVVGPLLVVVDVAPAAAAVPLTVSTPEDVLRLAPRLVFSTEQQRIRPPQTVVVHNPGAA